MTTFHGVLGVLILICALFLIISVLLQSSKNHRMSGVISGGADTFFGKQKGKTIDALLSKATAVISVIFCILILVLYISTAKSAKKEQFDDIENNDVVDTLPESGITDEIEIVEDGAVVEGTDGAEVSEAADTAETTGEENSAESAEETEVTE